MSKDKENASFLKMIGLESESDSGPMAEISAEDTENSEETVKEMEVDLESTILENIADAEPEAGWNQAEITPADIFENHASQIDLNNRTALYSEREYEEIVQKEVASQYEEADRFLEGLEEADESRATDLFAKSFRSDSRETNLLDAEDTEKDNFEDFDENSDWTRELDDPQIAEDILPGEMFARTSLRQNPSESSAGSNAEEASVVETFSSPVAENDLYSTQALSGEGSEDYDPDRQTAAFNYASHTESKEQPKFVHLSGDVLSSRDLNLDRLPYRLGRDPTNDIVIDENGVSRFHAEIRQDRGELEIIDLDSTNGMKINGERLTHRDLRAHDVVQVGEAFFEFVPAGLEARGLQNMHSARETEVQMSSSAKSNRLKFLGKTKRQRILRLVASIMIVGAGYLYLNKDQIAETATQTGQEMLFEQAQKDSEQLRSELELRYDRPIQEIDDESVRNEFLKRIDAYGLVPGSVRSQLAAVHPKVIRIFVEEPQVFSAFAKTGGDVSIIMSVIRNRMQAAINKSDFHEALEYVDILLSASPNDSALLKAKEDLKAKTNYVKLDTNLEDEITDQDRDKFETYMTNYQTQVQGYMEKGDLEAAKNFAEIVKQKIITLVQKQPAFASLTEGALAEWSSKIKFIESKIEERKQNQNLSQAKEADGDKLILDIRAFMNSGRVYESSLAIEKFLANYPKHPDVEMVKGYRQEIDNAVNL
ncbi:MAG: hypothetical protein COV44_01830, partial [Deltaproteobacteria bacterium CG11_big_fil_rev_8_21_14_0_20_45_16]